MKLYNAKLFFGFFVLLTYISIGVFGLFELSHATEMPMANCPYAQNSFSVCENSLDHINNWQQFSNITFPSLFTFLLLTFGLVLYFYGKQNFLNQKQYFYKWKYYLDNKKLYSYSNRIIKWLSLFENSPSLSYKA
ncbi:hypothetical protein A3H53_03860 [Candidatus Nomurabacteria bacterium RIFCSPLOWO2_02_FULL_40_10]|uniref:Uncharacterized protein n=2 Tax=Candidatus Nomuraibacteriota TaxID=1752729 RepID=A0A1F6XW54_9BACT|nr:MAG: hypothetical protein A2642_01320 [Candidatus Nomurabacteria bacterium RIFCSPHIGHO2_01_FULL_39_10]OGI98248.1 MAG: hypothetical protein A3H53_03860 [Candidatus Nomurabacteria bacterium RIFCSPLOWO2_02_FULL_40_10]